jgi:hypothetical protein
MESVASYLLSQSEAESQEARIMMGCHGVYALLVELHACPCELAHGARVVEGRGESLNLDLVVLSLKGWASKATCVDMFMSHSLGYIRG